MGDIKKILKNFSINGKKTEIKVLTLGGHSVSQFINEFWTSKQRQSSSLHEISYRACFKAELPNFFITSLTSEGDVVYDPFSGRGTTAIEAGLLGRNIIVNDINPLTKILTYPRFFIPDEKEIELRLNNIPSDDVIIPDIDLSMFYHEDTLQEILRLKRQFLRDNPDNIDNWIRMVATSRLTGHSKGYFSVYTLPPNQAVTQKRQIEINKRLNQIPEYRNTKDIILKKSKTLKKDVTPEIINKLKRVGKKGLFLNKNARDTPEIKDNSVSLLVTSPPFLDVINYAQDNWLRCWFNGIDAQEIGKHITTSKTLEDWCDFMQKCFHEFFRIMKVGGKVAFEVGEVKHGTINLDEYIVLIGINEGFKCEGIMVNDQEFTKTANIWGVSNNNKGTNTNRIVLFSK